jgi:hypothetical protein
MKIMDSPASVHFLSAEARELGLWPKRSDAVELLHVAKAEKGKINRHGSSSCEVFSSPNNGQGELFSCSGSAQTLEAMTDQSWQQYNTNRQKRKRAALACQVCHSKKVGDASPQQSKPWILITRPQVKCDLQSRSAEGNATCTNCALTGGPCQ